MKKSKNLDAIEEKIFKILVSLPVIIVSMILLIGPSASGKTEIARALTRLFGIKKAVTHTTRAPRVGEVSGRDYHFVSKEDFLDKKEKGGFVETTLYNGNYYGCSKEECADDRCIVVDPQGLASFRALNDPRLVTFYLRCDEATRKARMESRGDEPKAILSRLENDAKAFDDEKLSICDFTLSTETKGIEELAKEVYRLYKSRL